MLILFLAIYQFCKVLFDGFIILIKIIIFYRVFTYICMYITQLYIAENGGKKHDGNTVQTWVCVLGTSQVVKIVLFSLSLPE